MAHIGKKAGFRAACFFGLITSLDEGAFVGFAPRNVARDRDDFAANRAAEQLAPDISAFFCFQAQLGGCGLAGTRIGKRAYDRLDVIGMAEFGGKMSAKFFRRVTRKRLGGMAFDN